MYDLTDFGKNNWQNQVRMAKRPQNTGKNTATTLYLWQNILESCEYLSSAGKPGWTRLRRFFIIYVNGTWRMAKKKKKGLLIHLSSAILYITVTSVCEKHFPWISPWSFLREKDEWGTASRPKQSCAADVCLFLEQHAPASLHCCAAQRLKFWCAEWIHWALEMTATFSISAG